MRICYNTVLGPLAIVIVESPFCLSAEINCVDNNLWKSPKYTLLNTKHWKLTDQKIDDDRVAFIWSAAHKPPKIGIASGRIVVTITPGLDLPLTKRIKKEMLSAIVEVDEPKDDRMLGLMDRLMENNERECHKRYFAEIDSINICCCEKPANE